MGGVAVKSYVKDYPRPQFVRENWENLNGTWEFAFDDDNLGEQKKWYCEFQKEMEIQVPFTYETKLSGIQEEGRHDHIWYHRTFLVEQEKLDKNSYILHFEGSDYRTKVWVNGQFIGSHEGGYSRFSFDVTNAVRDGENQLTVKVEDSYDMQQPRGKQRWKKENFACWYVQTTGIWKTVWSEYVPKYHIDSVKMTPKLEEQLVDLEVRVDIPEELWNGRWMLKTTIHFQEHLICQNYTAVVSDHLKIKMDVFSNAFQEAQWGVMTWAPGNPNLYDIEFELLDQNEIKDKIQSYFGMRDLRIDGPNIVLNGKPIYQRLILDQGYWKDSHLTPPSEEALIEDIDKILALGYNGLRKHQKTEDERFLYWCDVKGVLVWSEMASSYEFSEKAVTMFTQQWMEIVKQNYNHPSIITWTPINESWGVKEVKVNRQQQHFTEMIYHLTKSIDPYRPVIVNDGWEHTVSDIITLHDYEEVGSVLKDRYMKCKDQILDNEVYHAIIKAAFSDGYGWKGQPILISEYGGIAFNNDDSGWGYGNKVNTEEEFIRRFDDITTAVKELPYVCGFCYTQVTDVQQEINGLMDIDRNFKIDPEIIRKINERRVGFWR